MGLEIEFGGVFLFLSIFSTPPSSSLFSLIIACSLLSVIPPSHINDLSFMHLPYLCTKHLKNSFGCTCIIVGLSFLSSLLLTITTYYEAGLNTIWIIVKVIITGSFTDSVDSRPESSRRMIIHPRGNNASACVKVMITELLAGVRSMSACENEERSPIGIPMYLVHVKQKARRTARYVPP
jgi:hypothetical protein